MGVHPQAWIAGALLIAAQPQGASSSAGPTAEERWAGHEILVGHVELPILGKIETRTDNFVLARVQREGDVLRLIEHSCRSYTPPVLGSSVAIDDHVIRRLPPATLEFRPAGAWMIAAPSVSGWGEMDADGDGRPGVTFDVVAPICGGRIYASTHNVSVARGRMEGARFTGELRVRASQNILGTSSTCLDLFAGNRREELRGTFAFVPVAADADCDTLGAWPVRADDPDRPAMSSARRGR